MPLNITRYEYFKQVLSAIDDDFSRRWSDYPCVNWPYASTRNGYGCVWVPGDRYYVVPRLSFSIANPSIDISNCDICHHCDNPPCFRPIHLFSGSTMDNMHDMIRKGRYAKNRQFLFGEDHPGVKITREHALEVRRLRSMGLTYPKIAAQTGVSESNVCNIIRRKTWANI